MSIKKIFPNYWKKISGVLQNITPGVTRFRTGSANTHLDIDETNVNFFNFGEFPILNPSSLGGLSTIGVINTGLFLKQNTSDILASQPALVFVDERLNSQTPPSITANLGTSPSYTYGAFVFNLGTAPTSCTHFEFGGTVKTTGGMINNTSRYTTTQTLTSFDHIVFCDTDGGAWTLSLPAGVEGTNYKIINCGSSGNDLTVDPNGTEQLFGAGAGVSQNVSDGEVINIHYNATEGWF